MSNFCPRFAFLFLLVAWTAASGAEIQPSPARLASILPKGWGFLDSASADLDGNATTDFVVMVSRLGQEDPSAPRKLMVLTTDSLGALQVAKVRTLVAVNPANAGASLEDRFQGLSATSKSFSLHLGSGGGWSRFYQTFRFGWSRRDRTWQLVEVENETLEISPDGPDRTSTIVQRPPKDFGKIGIESFDPDHYLGVGPR
ncbi:MAG: hypothetical protein IPK50_04585 [Fibrobacterota bacterium]|nr:hypothetical protein [Fibrobacterota bacterium]QQS06173.1 MAG: hypothetical protein IPK50_04585 [Fibrobacterota bacterium]